MNNEMLPNDYRETLNLIIQKIQLAQQKAVISANMTMLDLYWEIGNVILNKKKEKGWGAKVIETLSKDITSAFPWAKGYSIRRSISKTHNSIFIGVRSWFCFCR